MCPSPVHPLVADIEGCETDDPDHPYLAKQTREKILHKDGFQSCKRQSYTWDHIYLIHVVEVYGLEADVGPFPVPQEGDLGAYLRA